LPAKLTLASVMVLPLPVAWPGGLPCPGWAAAGDRLPRPGLAAGAQVEPGPGDRAAPGPLAAPARPRNKMSAADAKPTTL
jgi:hypothetical protein